ncbi:unnamed protein product [Enterobius vermicularis]|uniref:Uncharacterized protein n=1 Tax=Enterobius vermicularis TaxID=51028 RepID=A0A0N4UU61_ENTVE|nr:unnamed protein product [Enterobius vermicularis]
MVMKTLTMRATVIVMVTMIIIQKFCASFFLYAKIRSKKKMCFLS